MKKIFMALIILLCLLLLVSCSKNSSKTTNTTALNEKIDNIIPEDDDIILDNGDLSIVDGKCKFDGTWYEYKFVIRNDSEYDLSSLTTNCSICDKDGNVLDTDSGTLDTTLPSGKQGTIKRLLSKDDVDGACYIIIDSYYYDGNGNNIVFELPANKENAEQTKIIIPSDDGVTENNLGELGMITQPSDETVKKNCVDFEYDEVMSNPTKYEEKYFKLKGRILAKQTSGKVMMVFRVDITPDSFSSNDKIVNVTYIDDYIDSSNYKEGDIITIYGKFTGVGTYDTAYSNDIKMPKISANIVEKS